MWWRHGRGGWGWLRPWCRWAGSIVFSGYRYIGPCRCGAGPHAFYQDPSGRIIHARELWLRGSLPPSKEDIRAELEMLKEEKAAIEKQIEELEKQIKEKGE